MMTVGESFDFDATARQSTGAGSIFRQLGYVSIFVAALVGSKSTSDLRRLFVIPTAVTVLLAWCLLSLLWSVAPDVGVRRLILTTQIIWIIFILGRLLAFDQLVAVNLRMMILIIAMSYAAALLFPSFGVHQYSTVGDVNLAGSWRGVFFHKNLAGPFCAMAAIFCIFDNRKTGLFMRLLVTVAASYFLYRTESKTSIYLLVASVLLGFLSQAYKPRYKFAVLLMMAIVTFCAALFAPLFWDQLTAPLDSPDAFSGRMQIWLPVVNYAKDHLLLGAGYGSFWNVGSDSPILRYTVGKAWIVGGVSEAHNGYLDVLAQIGIVGLMLAAFSLILVPIWMLLSDESMPKRNRALCLAVIFFGMSHNLTESSLLDRDKPVEVYLVMAVSLLAASANRHRNGRVLQVRPSG